MKLLELFQTGSQPYEWQKVKPTLYTFQGKERLYTVTFLTIEEPDFEDYNPFKDVQLDLRNSYDLMFFAQDPRTKSQQFDIIGSGGDQIKIFATVIDIFKDFVQTTHPDLVRFSAKEESRKRLYNRFLRLAEKHLPTAKTRTTLVDNHIYYWMLFKTK
jgi:hypothetical protein